MTDQAYDDGSEVVIRVDPEDPPESGVWVDSEAFIEAPTEDEIAMGNLLGKETHTGDDEDNGADVIRAVEELS